MNGLYDILESYRQQNDPRFIYEGLYEQPAYTGPNIDPMYNLGARQFGNMNRMDFGVPQQATGIMQQAPQIAQDTIASNLLYEDMPSGGDYDYDYDYESIQPFQEEEERKKSNQGLAGLFKTLIGLAIPGAGFLMNSPRRGLEGIRSLNQRIQGSDFGQATSIADYLDMRKYGGLQGRRDAAARNMAQARGLQKQIDQRPTATQTNQDRGRGDRPGGANYSAPSRPSRSSGFSSSARGKALHG